MLLIIASHKRTLSEIRGSNCILLSPREEKVIRKGKEKGYQRKPLPGTIADALGLKFRGVN